MQDAVLSTAARSVVFDAAHKEGAVVQIAIPTLESLLEPYRHYPKIIQQALLLVETHPSFSVLTKATRRVLKAMVARCSKHDAAEAIFARVDRLAREADVCTKTVQRALASLRRIGWLRDTSDGRDGGGAFTYRHYWFSDDLLGLLRLPVGSKKPARTEMSDGVYIDLTFKEDQREIPGKSQGNPKPVELPPELASVVDELGIKDTGIAKLRGEAHRAGHDLAHIIACARQQLAKLGARGGRAFRYLQAMIAKPADYASRAAQTVRVEAEAAREEQTKDRARKYRHKRFVGPAGMRVRIFDGIGEIVLGNGQIHTLVGDMLEQTYDRIESGYLVEQEA